MVDAVIEWSMMLALVLLVSVIGVVLGLAYKGFDRKITAMMQSRIGPPLRQPFRDVKKLFMKETIIPDSAVPWLFNAAPIFALVASLVAFAYLPLGPFEPIMEGYGGLILLIYLLAIPAVAMALGGLASGSPYATVGSQRELVLMISYELPLAVAAVTFGYNYESFSIAEISSQPVWGTVGIMGAIGFTFILAALVAVMPGELSKIPFDQAEAETELAEGLFVEYSGRNLGLFYVAEVVKMVFVGALFIALFFPYQLSSYVALSGPTVPMIEMGLWAVLIDVAFFLFKLLIIIYVGVSLIRVAFARFQIDRANYFYWGPMTVIGLIGTLLVVLENTGI